MNNLFWCWNSEFERWQPNNIQTKSIKFLRDTVDSLGDYSSLCPEIVNEQNAIKVVGKSGLIYLLSETINPIKYDVKAIPYESMISEIDDEGLPLCIDSQASIHFPPGDVVASYLLALHNDVESQEPYFHFRCATQPPRFISELEESEPTSIRLVGQIIGTLQPRRRGICRRRSRR